MEIGLSDFHLMTLTILRCNYIKCKPKILTYRCFKYFGMVVFRQELTHAYSGVVNNITYDDFEGKYITILNNHAPLKQRCIRGNDQQFMTKTMRKAIMCRTQLKNIYHKNPSDTNLLNFENKEITVSNSL